MLVPYLATGLLAGLVGAGELISRYRDSVPDTFAVPATWVYVLLNAGAGIGALYLLRTLGWDLSQTSTTKRDVLQVLVASFAALAFFRSSLFVVKVGDENVAAGPSLLLTALLGAADRSVDRHQAKRRNDDVAKIMKDVVFDKAVLSLPSICLGASASTSPADAATFRASVDKLHDDKMSPHAKSLALGLMIVGLLGTDVLKSSIEALGDDIRATVAPTPRTTRATAEVDG